VNIGRDLTVDNAAERFGYHRVQSFETAGDWRGDSSGCHRLPHCCVADVDRIVFDQTEDERPTAELRLQKLLDLRRLPWDCDEIIHPIGKKVDCGSKRLFTTVVDENRQVTTHN